MTEARRPRVLVVDDDEVFRISARRGLDRHCDVSSVVSAAEADAALASEAFDCVLLDHILPGDRTGLEIAVGLVERGIAVVMTTAAGDETVAVEALKLGCRDYLPKRDLTPGAILRTVLRAIEAQRREQELSRTREALETFAQVAAHDLKSPARQVKVLAEMASEALSKGHTDDLSEHLEFLEKAGQRMLDLVNALHRHTVIGLYPLQTETVALEELVDGLFGLARADAPAGVMFTRDALPEVVADRTLISQLLQNLVQNAVAYRGKSEVRVHVSGRVDAGEYVVSVADDGPGIAEGSQEAIFEPLRRLVSKREVPGTGLGLATCRKIMRLHRGRIWVSSTVGEGSTFFIAWPQP